MLERLPLTIWGEGWHSTPGVIAYRCVGLTMSAFHRGLDYMIGFTCMYGTSTKKAISFDGHRCWSIETVSYCVFISLYDWFCGRGYRVSISLFDPLWAGQWASGISRWRLDQMKRKRGRGLVFRFEWHFPLLSFVMYSFG